MSLGLYFGFSVVGVLWVLLFIVMVLWVIWILVVWCCVCSFRWQGWVGCWAYFVIFMWLLCVLSVWAMMFCQWLGGFRGVVFFMGLFVGFSLVFL